MQLRIRRHVWSIAVLLVALMGPIAMADAPSGDEAKVSVYAPAADLVAQVDYFMKHIGEALGDAAQYDDVKQTTVERDSNTLAVLGLVLALHDEDHRLKPQSPAIIDAAQALAENYENHDAAVEAFEKLKKAVAGEGQSDREVAWEVVADMSPLMKQVPVIHAPMKRGATDPRRFKRQAVQTAGQAATLAAIAQAAKFNTDHASDEQIPQWEKFCLDMRNACGDVNSAVRAGDADKAAKALDALQKSCDDCHGVFRAE